MNNIVELRNGGLLTECIFVCDMRHARSEGGKCLKNVQAQFDAIVREILRKMQAYIFAKFGLSLTVPSSKLKLLPNWLRDSLSIEFLFFKV